MMRCLFTSFQMDSGYNTQTCGSNITDIVGTESYCKENVTQSFEVETKSQVTNIKVWMTQLDKALDSMPSYMNMETVQIAQT